MNIKKIFEDYVEPYVQQRLNKQSKKIINNLIKLYRNCKNKEIPKDMILNDLKELKEKYGEKH